jgi:hypothetical protein
MADLSNLLGDVYGDPDDAPTADGAVSPSPAPEPPAWADESRLDEAFADWTPHPLEPAVAATPTAAPGPTTAPLDDDLAAALSAALADAPRPPKPEIERFAHVDADAPLDPPVVDAATLEPVPAVDLDAVEDAFVPPTPVVEPAPAPVPAKRRSLSLGRRSKPVDAAPAVTFEPDPAAAVVAPATPGRAWQRADDDILPAGAGSRRGGFRLR